MSEKTLHDYLRVRTADELREIRVQMDENPMIFETLAPKARASVDRELSERASRKTRFLAAWKGAK